MFYQGDLRSGINAAIEQSKLVACYVRSQGRWQPSYTRFSNVLNYHSSDDDDETTAWEDDFLTDPEVSRNCWPPKVLITDQMVDNEPDYFQGHPSPLMVPL